MDIYVKGKDKKTCICIDDEEFYTNQEENLSDNQCEWSSLLSGVRYYSGIDNRPDECIFFTDSLLLYQQLTFKKKTKADTLTKFYREWNRLKNTIKFRSNDKLEYEYVKSPLNKARMKLYEK